MKEKHGQYIPLYTDEFDLPFYIRGHVSEDEALAAILRYDDCYDGKVSYVVHRWARWRPVRGQEYDMELDLESAKGRGSFAVTEAHR